jgi:hypothetical protein
MTQDDYSSIRVGDRGIFAPQFLHRDQTPVSLVGCTITMKMELLEDIESGVDVGTLKTCDTSGGNAFVIDEIQGNDAGKAHRRWTAADTNTSGIWGLWITITDADGNPVHADDGKDGLKKLTILPVK